MSSEQGMFTQDVIDVFFPILVIHVYLFVIFASILLAGTRPENLLLSIQRWQSGSRQVAGIRFSCGLARAMHLLIRM